MSESSDTSGQSGLKIVIIGVDLPGGQARINVPVAPLFDAYMAVHALGTKRAFMVMTVGVMLWQQLQEQQAAESVLAMLEDEQTPGGIDPKELEGHVLGFCYLLLRQRVITWEQAASFATKLLDASPPIEPEAWRKKTERWVTRTGRAKVGKRRPREQTGRS